MRLYCSSSGKRVADASKENKFERRKLHLIEVAVGSIPDIIYQLRTVDTATNLGVWIVR